MTTQGTVSYTYDMAGRRASMTVAGQPPVSYTYDNADRLTQIMQGASTVTLAYDAAGRRTSLTLSNGGSVEYSYDTASRLTSLTYKQGLSVLGTLTYTYDAAGNRTQIGGSYARTGLPQAVASATYNAANQQLTLGNKTLTFDLNSNLATLTDPSGPTTYTWDARNRLASLSGPGLSASFQYDALGRRSSKTVNGTSTAFLYDGDNVVQELTNGVPAANLLTGLGVDEVFSRTDAGGARLFLPDALGSTVALTDSTGAVQTQYTYEPFGQTTVTGAASGNPFQYTGRENDGTGLYYYRARYYHPTLQRFISEDPIGFAGGDVNLYGCVGNNPINLVDPLGLISIRELLQDLRTKAIIGAGLDRLVDELGRRLCPGTTPKAIVDVAQGLLAAQSAAFFIQAAVGAGLAAVTVASGPVAVIGGLGSAAVMAGFGGNEIARGASALQDAYDFFTGKIAPPVDPARCRCSR